MPCVPCVCRDSHRRGFAPPRPYRNDAPETKEHGNVKLYVRGQLALAHRDSLIPQLLNFLVVVVDPEGLSLNFSRETLRQNNVLRVMSDLGLVGFTGVFAPAIVTGDEDVATGVDGDGMPASGVCAPPDLAELDRPLEVVSQNPRPQVAEVTSRAPRQQDSPRLSQPLISLLSFLRQVSEVAHDTQKVTSTVVHSIKVHSS